MEVETIGTGTLGNGEESQSHQEEHLRLGWGGQVEALVLPHAPLTHLQLGI